MTPLVDKYQELLDRISLTKSSHKTREAGVCAMEAAAWIAGEEHSDHPSCACPVITSFMVNWNDALSSDIDRDRLLKPLLPLVVDTRATKAIEKRRSYMALDWLIREHIPEWLDLTPVLKPSGDALRATDEIVSAKSLRLILPLLTKVRIKSDAARAAAGDAARAAAWAAAGDYLRPTVEKLQISAQDLVRLMCAA